MKPLSLSRDLTRKLSPIASLSFCLFSAILAIKKLDHPLIGIDDANIYFVYARNLANGYGLVYNVGSERVEGFTSLLWMSICALAFKFSTHPELTLLVINIILVSLGIAYAVHHLQHAFASGEDKRQTSMIWSLLYLVLIFSSARYVVWNTITLMENALWSTLLLLLTLFVIRDDLSPKAVNSWFIPLAILLLLTRPESNLWIVIFSMVLFLRIAFRSDFASVARTLLPSLIGIVLTVLLLTAFRLSYFGYPFPNTYYAKVSPLLLYNIQQGSRYLLKYSLSDPVVTLCIVAIMIAIARALLSIFSKRRPVEGCFYLPFIAGVGLLAPVLVGGDHFGSFRVYQNIYPIEVLTLLIFLKQVLHEYSRSEGRFKTPVWITQRVPVFLSLVLAFSILQSQWTLWNLIESEVGIEFQVADYGRKNGTFIQSTFAGLPELPSLGVVTSGGIKYTYSGLVIDLLGLNNTVVAHNGGNRVGIKDHAAFDIPTFHQLHPDLVWPLTVDTSAWQYQETEIKDSWENSSGLEGLFDDMHFQELYTYAKVSLNTETKYAVVGWYHKDLLHSLQVDGNFYVQEYEYGS